MQNNQVVYGPLTLPSGRKITFREPLGLDRVNVQSMVPITEENAVGDTIRVESKLRAKCVVTVDGKQTDGDYMTLMDKWPDVDIQYYSAVFNELFGMTEEKREEAKTVAKNLRAALTSTGGSNSKEESGTTNG